MPAEDSLGRSMDRVRIARLGVSSIAGMLGGVMACAGLLTGVLYAVGGLAVELSQSTPLNRGTALAFLALPGMAALFGAAGLAVGALVAALYNLTARRLGGVVVELDPLDDDGRDG